MPQVPDNSIVDSRRSEPATWRLGSEDANTAALNLLGGLVEPQGAALLPTINLNRIALHPEGVLAFARHPLPRASAGLVIPVRVTPEALSDSTSSWHPAELTRRIAAAIPTDVHIPAASPLKLWNG